MWNACRRMGTGPLVILVGLLGAGLEAAAQEEKERDTWLSRLDAEFPLPPDEALSTYLSLVKGSPLFEVASALRVEKVKPLIEAWAQESGFAFELRTDSFLHVLEKQPFRAEYGSILVLAHDEFESDLGPEIDLKVLYVEPKEPPPDYEEKKKQAVLTFDSRWNFKPYGKRYRLRGDHLEELHMDVVTRVTVMHPALRRLEVHSVQDMPLGKVLVDLCGLADFDYTYKSDDGNDIRVTQELRDRTVKDCLVSAAGVAGFQVLYDGNPRPPRERSVSFSEVRDVFISRKYLGWSDPKASPAEAPLDALRRLVLEDAQALKERRYVITLKPLKE